MGFDAASARTALARCGGRVDEAVQLLLDAPENVGEPIPPAPAPAPPPVAVPTSTVPVAVSSPPHAEAGRLVEMGFPQHAVDDALRRAGGDRAAALQILLGGGAQPAQPPAQRPSERLSGVPGAQMGWKVPPFPPGGGP